MAYKGLCPKATSIYYKTLTRMSAATMEHSLCPIVASGIANIEKSCKAKGNKGEEEHI